MYYMFCNCNVLQCFKILMYHIFCNCNALYVLQWRIKLKIILNLKLMKRDDLSICFNVLLQTLKYVWKEVFLILQGKNSWEQISRLVSANLVLLELGQNKQLLHSLWYLWLSDCESIVQLIFAAFFQDEAFSYITRMHCFVMHCNVL